MLLNQILQRLHVFISILDVTAVKFILDYIIHNYPTVKFETIYSKCYYLALHFGVWPNFRDWILNRIEDSWKPHKKSTPKDHEMAKTYMITGEV